MQRVLIAIDPGITGAYAIFNAITQQHEHVGDLPIIRDMSTGWIDADHFKSTLFLHLDGRPSTAIIERVHAMPSTHSGSRTVFSQGLTLGSILATLQIVGCGIEMVSPASWKAAVGLQGAGKLSAKEKKNRALDKARLLFPNADLERQKDHNRAEALLIGHWYLNRNPQRAAA
jgi:hypothetical protein